MKIFRDNLVKKEFLAKLLLCTIGAVVIFLIDTTCGLVFLCVVLGMFAISYAYAVKRGRKIAGISEKIDELLHDESVIFQASHEEGELAILESEILKMTKRIRESTDALIEDKVRLTRAIEDIFHQLRTPLTSMALSTSILSEEELSYTERIKHTRDIKKQISRATWLVETLLKISKIDAGTASFKNDNVKVADMLSAATESILIPLELRDISLEMRVQEESFIGDIMWLSEAFGNIIKNCMEHTPMGGEILVEVSENALYTEIDISDNGEGFNKEDIPYLFDRFYKGKNSSKESYGIGLALSKIIINKQNGTIKALNGVNGGARFEIKMYKSIV